MKNDDLLLANSLADHPVAAIQKSGDGRFQAHAEAQRIMIPYDVVLATPGSGQSIQAIEETRQAPLASLYLTGSTKEPVFYDITNQVNVLEADFTLDKLIQ